jgi:ribosome-binding protein aMBF1 (putative translation factor)
MARGKPQVMKWLDNEIVRRGRNSEVVELLDEMRIEQQLADLRRKRGISQAKLAEMMGVNQPLIARMESGGVKNLTLATVARTAATLGARVEFHLVPAAGWRRKRAVRRA